MTDSAASFSGRATQASIPSLPYQGIYGDRQHALRRPIEAFDQFRRYLTFDLE
jgi:hypothetical protein